MWFTSLQVLWKKQPSLKRYPVIILIMTSPCTPLLSRVAGGKDLASKIVISFEGFDTPKAQHWSWGPAGLKWSLHMDDGHFFLNNTVSMFITYCIFNYKHVSMCNLYVLVYIVYIVHIVFSTCFSPCGCDRAHDFRSVYTLHCGIYAQAACKQTVDITWYLEQRRVILELPTEHGVWFPC